MLRDNFQRTFIVLYVGLKSSVSRNLYAICRKRIEHYSAKGDVIKLNSFIFLFDV